MTDVPFDDWQKLDLRVAEIKEVEDHPNADKLYVLKVDVGEERTIVAGIKPYYSKEQLVGKKVIIFVNLEPVTLRGVKSEGMLLAASSKEDSQCVFLQPEQDMPAGTRIS